ncbi:MAG: hypothetical protein AAGF12_08105 [Myxococcota bacterium]
MRQMKTRGRLILCLLSAGAACEEAAPPAVEATPEEGSEPAPGASAENPAADNTEPDDTAADNTAADDTGADDTGAEDTTERFEATVAGEDDFAADTVECTYWPVSKRLRIVARDYRDADGSSPARNPNRQLTLAVADVEERPGDAPLRPFEDGYISLNRMGEEELVSYQWSEEHSGGELHFERFGPSVLEGELDELTLLREGGGDPFVLREGRFRCDLRRFGER